MELHGVTSKVLFLCLENISGVDFQNSRRLNYHFRSFIPRLCFHRFWPIVSFSRPKGYFIFIAQQWHKMVRTMISIRSGRAGDSKEMNMVGSLCIVKMEVLRLWKESLVSVLWTHENTDRPISDRKLQPTDRKKGEPRVWKSTYRICVITHSVFPLQAFLFMVERELM